MSRSWRLTNVISSSLDVILCSNRWLNSMVALASEEICTPYPSGRKKICTKTQKCVATKRNRETNDAFQRHLHHWVHEAIHNTFVPSVIVSLVCSLSPARCVRCTHRFSRYLCEHRCGKAHVVLILLVFSSDVQDAAPPAGEPESAPLLRVSAVSPSTFSQHFKWEMCEWCGEIWKCDHLTWRRIGQEVIIYSHIQHKCTCAVFIYNYLETLFPIYANMAVFCRCVTQRCKLGQVLYAKLNEASYV